MNKDVQQRCINIVKEILTALHTLHFKDVTHEIDSHENYTKLRLQNMHKLFQVLVSEN